MELYHLTTNKAAKAIKKNGFKDNIRYCGIYDGVTGKPKPQTGIFWADCVLIFLTKEDRRNTEEVPESVFIINIPENKIADFEIVEKGKAYREWCIPATLVNRFFTDKTIYSSYDESLYKKPKVKIPFSKLSSMTRRELEKLLCKQKI